MASYKLIQNVEAEDKIIWKVSIKQFIFLLIAGGSLFCGYLGTIHIHWIFMIIFGLISMPFIFLGLPLGKDQPNEVWLMAQLNFLFRPKKRLWQPEGENQFLKIKKNDDSNNKIYTGQPADSEKAYQKTQTISQILDMQVNNQSNNFNLNNHNWEEQHEIRHQNMFNNFNDILTSQHQDRHQILQQNIDSKANLKNNYNSNTNTINQQNNVNFDTILKMAESENLKISTLENMLKDANKLTSLK